MTAKTTSTIKNTLILTAVLIIIQLICATTNTNFYLSQLTMAIYISVLIIGLCLVMGYAGQISLGHAGFFAIGGYCSAILTTYNFTKLLSNSNPIISFTNKIGLLVNGTDLYGGSLLYIQPWFACLIALALTIIIAFFIGIPVLKLKGHYLAMATLGFGIIIYRIVLAVELLGEADGLSDVPGFPLLPGLIINGEINNRITNYYIAGATLIIGMLLLQNLINSRVGRALRAIHGAEDAASSMGVDTARYKLIAFVISAVFASLAGIMLTHYTGGISPSDAGVTKSVRFVAIVAIGGMASIWGALTMAATLTFLSLRGVFGSYDDAVFGLILILVMLFAPDGILRLQIITKIKNSLKNGVT